MTHYVIADTHFWHRRILEKGKDRGGRPFANINEMVDEMKRRWNLTVKKKDDRVVLAGDVAMWKPEQLEVIKDLNGYKILVPGNHDNFHVSVYQRAGFSDVRGYVEYGRDDIIISHIPLHPSSMSRWQTNVHGHIHWDRVMRTDLMAYNTVVAGPPVPLVALDTRYFCISAEHLNYAPISLEQLRHRIAEEKATGEPFVKLPHIDSTEPGYGHGV